MAIKEVLDSKKDEDDILLSKRRKVAIVEEPKSTKGFQRSARINKGVKKKVVDYSDESKEEKSNLEGSKVKKMIGICKLTIFSKDCSNKTLDLKINSNLKTPKYNKPQLLLSPR